MNARKIKQIQEAYAGGQYHYQVRENFGLSAVQEYAINIFGRDHNLSAEYLSRHMHKVKNGMTIGELAVALGFPTEAALSKGE